MSSEGGFVVATDLVSITRHMDGTATLNWVSREVEEYRGELLAPFQAAARAERLYWVAELRTMTGEVEKATVYESEQDAESAAFFAASLDPNLAGHLHVTKLSKALHDERDKIQTRRAARAMRERHESNRFKLTSGEGGGV